MTTLYSNGCPRCKQLEAELNKANIEYKKIDNMDLIIHFAKINGLSSVPILQIDNEILNYDSAIRKLRGQLC